MVGFISRGLRPITWGREQKDPRSHLLESGAVGVIGKFLLREHPHLLQILDGLDDPHLVVILCSARGYMVMVSANSDGVQIGKSCHCELSLMKVLGYVRDVEGSAPHKSKRCWPASL